MLLKALFVAGTASASCLHGLYSRSETVEISEFGYEHDNGPLVWAGLKEENEACSTGSNQSPINIDSQIKQATSKPILNIPQQAVEFENLGSTVEIVVNGTTTFDNKQFQLAQFHIHTPSEHRINREYSPLEVHMVHKGVTDPTQIVVLALLFELSTTPSDPIIAGITPHLPAISSPGTKTAIEHGLDFSSVTNHIANASILQYTGSLTTPPCSEGVTFLLVEQPLAINVPDFNAIKKVVKFNSRVTQNVLGEENIIVVAALSMQGNASAARTESVVEVEAAETTGKPLPGQTVTVTEISGAPVATPVVAVVQRRGVDVESDEGETEVELEGEQGEAEVELKHEDGKLGLGVELEGKDGNETEVNAALVRRGIELESDEKETEVELEGEQGEAEVELEHKDGKLGLEVELEGKDGNETEINAALVRRGIELESDEKETELELEGEQGEAEVELEHKDGKLGLGVELEGKDGNETELELAVRRAPAPVATPVSGLVQRRVPRNAL
ncbi:carbonic anhydrase [Massarina eburnea CBS 473.64]|uniref:carbonic anhydrase n=1 Tax=Massarina eburnea CBS 473.64 TaxID=1395130 RepID=A0A6A6S5Y5_9PLEO|nr:carbonic anhydrase [Massarina eburnea CBS 473.64]